MVAETLVLTFDPGTAGRRVVEKALEGASEAAYLPNLAAAAHAPYSDRGPGSLSRGGGVRG